MSAAAPGPWYVRTSLGTPRGTLPAGAPLAAQYLHGALAQLSPVIRGDIRAGRYGSRRIRVALAQLATVTTIPLTLTRAEIDRAGRYLARMDAETGGLILSNGKGHM